MIVRNGTGNTFDWVDIALANGLKERFDKWDYHQTIADVVVEQVLLADR